jgi:hypothetical protein
MKPTARNPSDKTNPMSLGTDDPRLKETNDGYKVPSKSQLPPPLA